MTIALMETTKPFRTLDRTHGVAPATSIALVLIDDNRLLREGLTAMIHAQPGFRVLASSPNVDEALERARGTRPDVVMLTLGLADHNSLLLTETIRSELPEAKVIVTGLLATQVDVAAYVRAGVSGFIMRDASSEEFFETIRQVASGRHVLPKALTTSLFTQIVLNADGTVTPVDHNAVRERVTAREREVIDALADGLSNKEIAARLHIAVHTVKSHVHNVLEKLSLHSRLEVAAFLHAASREGAMARRLS